MAAAVADDRGGSDSNNADLRCSRPRAAVPVVAVMAVVAVVVVVVVVETETRWRTNDSDNE